MYSINFFFLDFLDLTLKIKFLNSFDSGHFYLVKADKIMMPGEEKMWCICFMCMYHVMYGLLKKPKGLINFGRIGLYYGLVYVVMGRLGQLMDKDPTLNKFWSFFQKNNCKLLKFGKKWGREYRKRPWDWESRAYTA